MKKGINTSLPTRSAPRSLQFVYSMLKGLGKATEDHSSGLDLSPGSPDHLAFNAALAGVQPKDETEAILAAQMLSAILPCSICSPALVLCTRRTQAELLSWHRALEQHTLERSARRHIHSRAYAATVDSGLLLCPDVVSKRRLTAISIS
jgi:hypothetical protein